MKQSDQKQKWAIPGIFLVTGIAVLILWFSIHSGSSSNLQSEHIEWIVAQIAHWIGIYHPNLHFLQVFYPEYSQDLGNLLIRKLSHFTEYAIFGMCCTLVFGHMQNRKWAILLNITCGPLLALLDEKVVQAYLSVGRTSSYRDVLLDSVGFFCGALIVLLIHALTRLPNRRNAV